MTSPWGGLGGRSAVVGEGDRAGHTGSAEPTRLQWPDTPSIFEPFTIDVPAEGDFPGGSAPMPADCPAGLRLFLHQIQEAHGPVDLMAEEVKAAARFALGHDRVNDWIDQGVTTAALEVAVDEAVTEYGRRRQEELVLATEGRRLLVAESRRLIEEALSGCP